ncbi:MAG: peptidyl-alpha-hydroxyglycine alpha-amidating lyase family protein [Acidimicrobiia bacterium]
MTLPIPILLDDWYHLPDHIQITAATSVAVDSTGQTYIGHRGDHPILVFDRDGTFLRSMGNDLIPWREGVVYEPVPGESAVVEFVEADTLPDPDRVLATKGAWRFLHGMHVDSDDCLWVTDVGSHVVHKFSAAGDLLLTLGTPGVCGVAAGQFNQPTDVARNAAGEIFVSDGYINSRVVKFSADGELLHTWGTKGRGPEEFNTPHAITVDDDGVVYVSDRTNFRIQRFDDSGRYLGEWTDLDIHGSGDGEINDLQWGPDGLLYLGNGRGHRMTVLDRKGRSLGSWGGPDLFRVIHGICFDTEGNLYAAEVKGHRVRKFDLG